MVGATICSAINCFIYRKPRGMDWVRGHSVCEHCGKQLKWWELVPVFSCVLLRARCSTCDYRFGYWHAIAEAACGVVFVVIIKFTELLPLALTVLFLLFIVIAFMCMAYVHEHKILR